MATINSGNSTTLYSTTQTTTSVNTASTLPQEKVNETNFTTLYSNTSASATGGGTSGNLLVSGNLRVLGTSDLEGAVTIGNSYRLPTSDGTANQVILTDGAGNLTFQNISAIADYAIQADTTTGGANLSLTNSGSIVDAVKFASGSNITVTRTDANTITISTIADDIPNGTARGQVLYWDGSAWTANNVISSSASANRLTAVYENSTAGVNTALFLRKDFTTVPYTTNDGVSIGLQVDSNSQATNQIANISASWDPAAPRIAFATNINNNTTGPFVTVASFTSALGFLPGNLEIEGQTLTINVDDTAADSYLYLKGTSRYLKWNNSTAQFELSNGINIGGNTYVNGLYSQTGESITINSDNTATDSYLYLKGTSVFVKYNNATDYIEMPRTAIDNVIIDNNTISTTTGNLILDSFNTAVNVDNDLYVGGFASVSGEYIKINADSTFADAYLYMNGTSRYLKWDASDDYFHFNSNLLGDQKIIAQNDLGTNGFNIIFNNDDTTAADAFLKVKRGASPDVNIKWNQGSSRWQFTNDGTTYYDMVVNLNDLEDVTITAPLRNGQLLAYRNGQWQNDNDVYTTDANFRNSFIYRPLTPDSGPNSILFLRKDYSNAAPGTTGVGTYANGAGSGLNFSITSDSQGITSYAVINGVYNSTNPSITLNTSTDNFATTDQVVSFDTNTASICATSVILDSQNGAAGRNSTIYANRGTSGADSYIQWSESGTFWNFSNTIFSAGSIIAGANLAANGNNIIFNNDGTNPPGDCFLTVTNGVSSGVNANIKWDDTNNRWQDTIDGTNYFNLPNQNLDTTDSVTFSQVTVDSAATINTQTTTTTSTAIQTISATTRVTQKVVISITDNVTGEIHVLEALAFQKGATAYLTTYAEMYSNAALATFTADVNTVPNPDEIRIRATPASSNSTTFTVVRIGID